MSDDRNGFPAAIPLAMHLGAHLAIFADGVSEVYCEPAGDLLNSYGSVHGGVAMALLDLALVHAARSPGVAGGPPRPACVTVNMNTNFMRPAHGRMLARGRLQGEPGRLAFCEAELLDAEGRACARATAVLRYVAIPAN